MTAIPRLPGLPLVGHLLAFRRDPIALLRRVAARCGDVGVFRLGPRDVVLVTSADYAREILVERAASFEKGPVVRRFARPLLGDGLIACENAVHKARRRLVLPAFHHRHVARYAEEMVAAAERVARGLEDGAVVDVAEEMTRLTLRVVGRALFSVDLVEEARELSEAIAVVLRHVTGRIERPLQLPLALPTPGGRAVRAAIDRLDGTILRMIAERRAAGSRPDGGDLLDALAGARDEETGGGLTDRQIRDEAMNLFVAGHETTATALAWTFYLLARHPSAKRRLHDELDVALGGRAPVAADAAALPYCGQVFQEAMRLYPPVHSLGREAKEPVSVGPYRLPAGAIVVVSPLLMHHRADYFPDPEGFHPERFTPPVEDPFLASAYLPFGAGPRACLGSHFAITEGQLVLATIARQVELEWPGGPPVEPEMLVVLRPRGPVRLRVKRR